MLLTKSGRVTHSTSLQPFRSCEWLANRAPRNAVSSSLYDWIIVPMAPSRITRRRARISLSCFSLSNMSRLFCFSLGWRGHACSGDKNFHRSVAVARHLFAGEGSGQLIVHSPGSSFAKPFFDGSSLDAGPSVRHLLAHPFLGMRHQIDQNHRAAGARNSAKLSYNALRIFEKMQHHHAKRRIYAVALQRRLESVALAKFDIF